MNQVTIICMLLSSLVGQASETQKVEQVVPQTAEAYFAGGCFWCMEPPFEKLSGVQQVISGYAGGTVKNPDYPTVASGKTDHREAVKVVYDPAKVSYEKLLDTFWRSVDPTDNEGQFVDRGFQYSTAIWFVDQNQKIKAEESKKKLAESKVLKAPIVTAILPFTTFYPAEEYHQDYYKKNPIRYKFYRYNSGRDQFLDKTWKKN